MLQSSGRVKNDSAVGDDNGGPTQKAIFLKSGIDPVSKRRGGNNQWGVGASDTGTGVQGNVAQRITQRTLDYTRRVLERRKQEHSDDAHWHVTHEIA